ncbi:MULTISPECIES: hypothetical protein [Gilliamella]|uniref:hypothetical protein n=1 Tax=Gilliamella TaxID=1193503 RepID=UPI001FCA0614|nr:MULTISPECIES: hypothetical protein [Gilliamella]
MNKIVEVIIPQGKLAVSVIKNKHLDVLFKVAGCQCQFMAIIVKGTAKKIANKTIVFFITNLIYKLN